MVKTEPGTKTTKQKAPESVAEKQGAEILHSLVQAARDLNAATTATEAIRISLRMLYGLITADALRLTTGEDEERQHLRAALDGAGLLSVASSVETISISQTVLARSFETAETVCVKDVSTELMGGALLTPLVPAAAQSVLCAPLVLSSKPIGIIVASAVRADVYSEIDADIAGAIAALLAAALERLEPVGKGDERGAREKAYVREMSIIERLQSAAQSQIDIDSIIQRAVDALYGTVSASFILLRSVSMGRPEPVIMAWMPGHDRPPLEINAPVSRLERTVYAEQRPVLIENAREERAGGSLDMRPFIERLGARALYFAPVVYGGQVLAAIGLAESDSQRGWTREEQALLMRVAETIAPLILNAQLYARMRSFMEELLTLLRLASNIKDEAELERFMRAALDSWGRIAGADASAILRWDEETERLRLLASKHLPAGLLERYTQGLSLSDPVSGMAAEKRVGVVADLESDARLAELHAAVRWSGLRSAWATPIISPSRKLLGVLTAFSRVVREVSADEQRLADLFALPVAISIENLERARKLRTQAQAYSNLEERVRQLEQHKSEFMSVISHELRTPLNAIIGYAQMLKDGFSGELNQQQRADVQTIADSADRLLSMVEDTLDLARMDAERFPIFMDAVAFDEVVRRALTRVRSMAEMKGLNIESHVSEDAPVVRTDPERVRQILTNLLSNAVKFTESGTIRINVERAETGGVQISVADTGIGFDTAAFPHIFDEFRQGDASNTRLHGGSGLGLAVSKRIVERLGGEIGVTSIPGEGSTFWFRLPPEIPGADA